jgi:hypothetical protein
MKTQQLALLVVAGVALGGAGLYVRSRQAAGFQQSKASLGAPVLGKFDASTIQGLRITAGTNQLNLVKSGDNWTVKERGGYNANFASIQDFVRKLVDLKATQPVSVGPSRLAALELTAPDKGPGVLVELLGADGKASRSLLLGKKVNKESKGDDAFGGGSWPIGRYVQVDGKLDSIAMVNEVLANAEPKPDDWLEKDWIKVEQPVAVSVTHPAATNSFALIRTNEFASWSLAEAAPTEKLDTTKLGSFGTLLSSPSFDDVVVDPKEEALSFAGGTKAVVKTAAGWTYEFQVGKAQEADRYPFRFTVAAELATQRVPGKDEKPEDKEKLDKEFAEKLKKQQDKLAAEKALSKWTFLTSRWSIDPFFKNRSELFEDPKKDDPKPAAGGADAPVFTAPNLPGAN